ncbi:MAG: nitronate monooxygenase, partial [Pseudobutyrivibrio sp.]|nr:nitronate monooxygenase [Pseudobutyrivibrio sp.]
MRLNEILGIEYPIIQGGMANIATGEFAAAVSNAGGLGLIGAGGMDENSLRENIRICKSKLDDDKKDKFGVNLMLMNPHVDAMAQVVVEEGVKYVTTGAGFPGKYMAAWKEAGIFVMPVVSSSVVAKMMER